MNNNTSKTITQERILKSLTKAGNYFFDRPEVVITETLASIGLKGQFNNKNPISTKDELELAYHGFTDPEQVLKRLSRYQDKKGLNSFEAIKVAWGKSFRHTLRKHWERRDKILNIQVNNNISGLELETVNLGDVAIQYHSQIDELKTLPRDFKILKNECQYVAERFCDAVEKYNMTLWFFDEKQDCWVSATIEQVIVSSELKDLAIPSEDKYYINQKELNERGVTTQKPELDCLQDKIIWEFHLILADESYPDKDSGSIWFCANLGDEKPSM